MSQSVLHPAGPMAERILGLWDLMYWVCAAVFVLVILALLAAVLRRRPSIEEDLPGPAEPRRRLVQAIGAATAVTVALLFVLLTGSVLTGRATASLSGEPLNLKVTGKQWWWQVEYVDPIPSRSITTANEIHVPVGRPVRIRLESTDVIHSFWVPSLHGKKDLIPGQVNTLYLQADLPGVFRGQCAEFCGFQHAHMALYVVAEPEEQFARWQEQQRRPAPEPQTEQQRKGRDVFMSSSCVLCHAIGGTPAAAVAGPNLTHVASRRSLAAGTLPNTPGHLAGWIIDPQMRKPGANMPPNLLRGDQLQALLSYLETLR